MRAISGFFGYFIDDSGTVWSIRGKGKPGALRDVPGRLRTQENQHGHPFIYLRVKMKRYKFYIHRLVLQAFVGPCPEGMECRHLDGNPRNNKLTNLKWGTRQENESDKVAHGTGNQGERNGMSKITWEVAEEIRKRYASGKETQKAIGMDYGISDGTVCNIVNYKAWTFKPRIPEVANDTP